jgi:hypothetical protein
VRNTIRLPIVAAWALIAGGCIAEREPLSPESGTKVRLALNVDVQMSTAGERIVEIRARYRRVNGEQPTLPVQPTQVVIEDGATKEQSVTIDVGACNADATRVRDGEAAGCRFTIELTLKNGAGETLGSDEEEVGPVEPGPGGPPAPTFVLSTPSLTAEPSNVGFAARTQQGIPAAQNVVVRADNASSPLGTLTTSITYSEGQGWLRATVDQSAHAVSLQPTTTALAVGTYRATVNVASSVDGMKARTIATTYQVTEQPTLVITGSGEGGGTVTSSPSGISCTIRVGVTSGTCSARFEPNSTITLAAAPSGSDRFGGWSGPCSGQGTCVITLAQSQTVSARFNEPAPVLQLSPVTLSFSGTSGGSNPARQTVSVVNGGGGTLSGVTVSGVSYPSQPPSPWLDAFVTGNTVSVGVTPGNLPAGTYNGTVSVGSANGGTATLGVTIVVVPRPALLRINPTSLSFAGIAGRLPGPRQIVNIVNDGGGTLLGVGVREIRYGSTVTGWLTAEIAGSTVSVGADPSKLQVGTFTATVIVGSTNGGTASLAVTFVVSAPPIRIILTPDVLTFTQIIGIAGPQSQTVRASNGGSGPVTDLGTLGVDAANTSSRLTIRFDGPIVLVVPNFSGLPMGSHRVNAVITSTRGGSATIAVTLNVQIG